MRTGADIEAVLAILAAVGSLRWAETWAAAERPPRGVLPWLELAGEIPLTMTSCSQLDAGGVTADSYRDWVRLEFSVSSTLAWHALGLSPDEAAAQVAAGARPAQVERWSAESGAGIDELPEWLRVGFTSSRAAKWRVLGWGPSEAAAWADAGFTPSRADKWWSVFDGDLEPSETLEWIDAGFTPTSAAEWWTEDGHPGVDWVQAWSGAGFDAESASEWSFRDFSPAEASAWREIGCSPEHATLFLERNWSRSVVSEWSAVEAASWAERGFGPEGAREWRDEDFAPHEARDWAKSGFALSRAVDWRLKGLSAGQVLRRANAQ